MKTTALLLLLLLPFSLFAQENNFEQPPVLSAAAILKPEYVGGPGFTVRDPVSTYGGRNVYQIDSDYGPFVADGNTMLLRRLREITAIGQLREVSRTDEFTKALAAAASSPLQVAKGLIENPVSTVSGIPSGLWKFMNRAGQGIKERADGRQQNDYEDSNARQLIGFSKVKRAVALELGVDPYSSNEVLQRELNGVAWASFAGKMTFSLATVPVGGAAGLALTATGVTSSLEQALRDLSPTDLRLANLKRLLELGCARADADAFLNNPAYSPSVQTALVLHLASMDGVADRPAFIRLAGRECANEGDALFFSQTARLLAELHKGGRPLTRIISLGLLPVAIDGEGNVVLALEWDYASWTQNAANFIGQLGIADYGDVAPTGYVVALTGDTSPMVQEQLSQRNITLAMRLSPGPLK